MEGATTDPRADLHQDVRSVDRSSLPRDASVIPSKSIVGAVSLTVSRFVSRVEQPHE